jgi:ABC-type phosphate transport system substrate-binding protein
VVDSAAVRRRMALGVAVLTAAGLLALVSPGSAAAAASSCAGRKVRTLPFSTGSVHVYQRSGYVCAMTFPKTPGSRKKMSVSVQARGSGDGPRGAALRVDQGRCRRGFGEFGLDPLLNDPDVLLSAPFAPLGAPDRSAE